MPDANTGDKSTRPAKIRPLPNGNSIEYSLVDPQPITFFQLQEHELIKLSEASRPIVLSFTTTFFGIAVGLLPSLTISTSKALTTEELVIIVVFSGTVVGAVICAIFAAGGIRRNDRLLREIKSRPRR